MEMTINKTQENGKTMLFLKGRLNTATMPQFQQALMQAFEEGREIVVDFNRLTYISSAGLRVLLLGQKMAKTKNIPMMLSNVSKEIMEVLDMTGFSDILTIL